MGGGAVGLATSMLDGSPMNDEGITLHTGIPIPPQLIANVSKWAEHELSPGWLASLPDSVAALCAKWSIELDTVIPETYMTLVLLGQSAKLGPVVIKSSPLTDEFRAEVTALELAAGDNVVRLYDVDLTRSIMLCERIKPGTQLQDVPMSDEEATRLAAETVRTFWRPVPDPTGLHPLRAWMKELFTWSPRPDRIDTELVEQAQDLGASLLADASRSCLLHGDFQHYNLLLREPGEWVIIDPKGLVGDPGFEIAAWMYNPVGVAARKDYLDLAERRLAIFADVWGIDEEELTAWAFVGAVLSACWSAGDPAPDEWLGASVRVARFLRELLGS